MGEGVDQPARHQERARPYQFRRATSDPNQGDVLLAGAVMPLVLPKALLTYAVPYSVSARSALSASRVEETT